MCYVPSPRLPARQFLAYVKQICDSNLKSSDGITPIKVKTRTEILCNYDRQGLSILLRDFKTILSNLMISRKNRQKINFK